MRPRLQGDPIADFQYSKVANKKMGTDFLEGRVTTEQDVMVLN